MQEMYVWNKGNKFSRRPLDDLYNMHVDNYFYCLHQSGCPCVTVCRRKRCAPGEGVVTNQRGSGKTAGSLGAGGGGWHRGYGGRGRMQVGNKLKRFIGRGWK